MLKPRWKKIARDLLSNKGRTILVVLAIAVGVFAFGSVFITQEVLLKNLQDEYINSHASNITITLSDFDSNLLDWVKVQTGVGDVDARLQKTVKITLANGDEEILNIYSVPDFSKLELNLLKPQKGTWPPKKGELVLERNSFTGGKFALGEKYEIKTQSERTFKLLLAGSVYDNSAIPYIFTQQMTGFVSWDTLGLLGFPKRFTQLIIRSGPEVLTLNDAEKMTDALTSDLEDRGVKVLNKEVTKPNQHWAADNSKAFTAILSVIGVFSLILSGFLVINTISALLSQQKKQIGIMKAVGGTQRQITSLYLIMVGIYGVLALFIALPIGSLLGYVFLKMVMDFLNMDINTFYLPVSVFFMELGAALIVPLIAASVPIIQGAKRSVRSAITDYQPVTKLGAIDYLLARISGVSLPILISLRNAFRKRGRLALTLGTLITAGALFMGVINVRASMFREMDRILQMFDFQVSISLNGDYATNGLIDRIKSVPNVTSVEARTGTQAIRILSDSSNGSQFGISGVPPNTIFSHPVILSGRWLTEGDTNQVVLSSSLVRDNPDLTPGQNLNVKIGNKKYSLEVVGVIAMSGDQKLAFMDFNEVARMKDVPNLASNYLIKTNPPDANTQEQVAKQVEDSLKTAGITVAYKQTKGDIIASAANQFNFLIFFLLAMALMVAIVGGLGLAGTMSLNVLERTREIGIMRSIGASDKIVRKLVLVEGILIGVLSFMIAIPISVPLTYGFCYAIGNAFFERTLVFSMVPLGALIWLGIVIIIAVIASLIPANRAVKMSINETLSYE